MKNIISLSGGKDSTAMLLWALEKETPNLEVVFCDTGNEHPLTYEYIEYLGRRLQIEIRTVKADFTEQVNRKREKLRELWSDDVDPERIEKAIAALQPTGNPFLDLCLWKGRFPGAKTRFCTSLLKAECAKEQVFLPLLAAGEDIDSWQGIRAEESRARAQMPRREFKMADKDTGAELWCYRPILEWKAEDCFAIMKKHMIAPNPLYKLGMARVGCMPCVMCRKSELVQIAMRFPDQIDRIRTWEKLVADASKRGAATFFPIADARGVGIDQVVEWSKTDRGGRQYGLFNDWDDLPACSSEYGLCE